MKGFTCHLVKYGTIVQVVDIVMGFNFMFWGEATLSIVVQDMDIIQVLWVELHALEEVTLTHHVGKVVDILYSGLNYML